MCTEEVLCEVAAGWLPPAGQEGASEETNPVGTLISDF